MGLDKLTGETTRMVEGVLKKWDPCSLDWYPMDEFDGDKSKKTKKILASKNTKIYRDIILEYNRSQESKKVIVTEREPATEPVIQPKSVESNAFLLDIDDRILNNMNKLDNQELTCLAKIWMEKVSRRIGTSTI